MLQNNLMTLTIQTRQVGPNALQWAVEALFYVFLFVSAFSHLILYLPLAAPAILAATTFIAGMIALKSPATIKCIFLPVIIVSTMAIIDLIGYESRFNPHDRGTLNSYVVWLMLFFICTVLHNDQGFFFRAKHVLIIYLFCHLIFLSPTEADPSRYGLREDLHLVIANANMVAYWCAFGIIASIAELFKRRGFWLIIYLVVIVICFIVILKTVSRSGMLGMVVCVSVFLMLNARQSRITGILILATFVFGLAWMLIISTGNEGSAEFEGLAKMQQRIESESTEGNYSFSDRTPLLLEGIKVFIESPWLGTGEDEVSPPTTKLKKIPHNHFIGIAVHYGIWPLLFFILIFINVVTKSILLIATTHDQSQHILVSELFVSSILLLIMASTSNQMVISHFAVLYMTKILTYKDQTKYAALSNCRMG